MKSFYDAISIFLAFLWQYKHFVVRLAKRKSLSYPRILLLQHTMQPRNEVSDEELKKVIADFLDQGHVENIVAMFRREPKYYAWTGEILRDERFSVRLGVSVLFEELQAIQPEKLLLAIPSLAELLLADEPLWRGEAVSILGIIGTAEALAQIHRLRNDPSAQVREMVALVLEESP